MTDNEKKYYANLNKEFMTDESDSSDSEHITVHKHPWRSQSKLIIARIDTSVTNNNDVELNEWFLELDSRYRRKLERKNTNTPSKERRTASPAKSRPPPGAPKWAVDPLWKSGKYVIVVCDSNILLFLLSRRSQ